MPKTLSYADAVRLLGGADSGIATTLARVAGGVLLAASPAAPALLALLDARQELVSLGRDALHSLSERRGGLSRYERTRRLEAAHTVLVVTAYFDALSDADPPVPLAEFELTVADQVTIAAGTAVSGDGRDFVALVQSAGVVLPASRWSRGTMLDELDQRYAAMSRSLSRFVAGLAAWDRMSGAERDRFALALTRVPARACERYEESLRRLAVQFPEVAYWVNLREHRGTQAGIREVGTALDEMERVLLSISTGTAPDTRRRELARAYRAALDRPVVASGDVPDGLRLPTLGEGYLTPRFRASAVGRGARLSDESWWHDLPVREDFPAFLTGYLTSGQATRAPLLVLGQPGSGKSVLTQVLAARLPAEDFLPVRVVLRDVPATAALQDQIEHAIRGATGERLEWPALARSAGDAVPVVFLDGFDELLQATGVSQTDYLAKVEEFQRREQDQGRAVAVIVTTRTSVADRAHVPDAAMAVRLEPFDAERVRAWLDVWNAVNAEHFRAAGLRPLSAEAVLAHAGLAEQPLLLFMLALYDADGNALRDGDAGLREDELYERLLVSFARREVVKHRPGLPDADLELAIEQELRRLSVVAFAMFNRGNQWVTEEDLEADLAALFRPSPAPVAPGFRAPLRAAELIIGRFFFVHRAQALRDDSHLRTYEFLHATFGEYLAARLIWQVLRDMAAREAAATVLLAGAPVGDDLLHALLSFATISARAPIIGFLVDMAGRLAPAERMALAGLLVRLFHSVHAPRGGRTFDAYRPLAAAVPRRHAAYSANLVLLILCTAGSITAGELFAPAEDAVRAWKSEVLLWRSQLDGEWLSIVDVVEVRRTWRDEARDLCLVLRREPPDPVPIDLFWSYRVAPDATDRANTWAYSDQQTGRLLRRANFLCRTGEDVVQNGLEPLAEAVPAAVSTVVGWDREVARSAAHMLLAAWTLPLRDPTAEERRDTYVTCARIAATHSPPWKPGDCEGYLRLLLRALATDHDVAPPLAVDVLDLVEAEARTTAVAPDLIRCALAFLGRDRESDRRLVAVIEGALSLVDPGVPALRHEVEARLA